MILPVKGDSPLTTHQIVCMEGYKVAVVTAETKYVTTVSSFQLLQSNIGGPPQPIPCK